jgi:hypothetical protein
VARTGALVITLGEIVFFALMAWHFVLVLLGL